MAKLSNIQWTTSLSVFCVVAAVGWAPGCTTSDGDGDAEGGAAGDDGAGGTSTNGGTPSRGGATSGGTSSGGGANAGAPGNEGGAAGSGGSDGSGAGAGGETGVNTCNVPGTGEGSALGKTCADYCTDFFTTCASYNTANSTFTDVTECRTSCENFGDAQLCCRAYHVENAAGTAANSATTHCPHAAGDALCN